MATGRITKRAVEAIVLPEEGRREYLWDESLKGFGCMVTPAGSRTYLVQYRVGGRGTPTRRYTIGRHGSPWTADKARERALDVLELVRKKIDPLEAERAAVATALASKGEAERLAFASYADFFLERHAERRNLRSKDDIRSVFRRDLVPSFGDRSLAALSRAEVQRCLDKVSERSGSAANKAHKWLRKLFTFAVQRGDLSASPMEGMGPPHQERKRQRVLRGQELALVWTCAERLGEPWVSFLHVLMLTGQRLREVAGMSWEELDLEHRQWIIPGARTKNKRDHLVPLAPAVIAILKRRPAAKKGPVFSTTGTRPIAGFSKLKLWLDREIGGEVDRIGGEPLEPWVFHDLRRSVGTGCQSLGFPIEHTEAVLNHVSGTRGGLAAIYQLHDYREEKRVALEAWAAHLVGLVECGR